MTGSSPVDRGKAGSKIHRVTDQAGLPLSVGVSAANTHDSHGLKPLIKAIPRVRSQRGPARSKPGKLHADKAYDHDELRRWLRAHGIVARMGIESSDTLGSYRWVIERSLSWLSGYRRLSLRYERYGHLFSAFATLAAARTCYKNSPHETRS